MKAEEIFKELSQQERLKDIPITHISRVAVATIELLFDSGSLMRNDYV